MNVFKFGDEKLRLHDIDPLYGALIKAKLTKSELERFTFAFVAFDHAAIAAHITTKSADKFWWQMHYWLNKTTIRGAPRRYFRGQAAHDAIETFAKAPVHKWLSTLGGKYAESAAWIKTSWPQFGPCAGFKICDMAERVCRVPVDFSEVTAAEICSNGMVQKGYDKAGKSLKQLLGYKWATLAPPHYDRPINQQEIETILCYYSHDEERSHHLPGMDKVNIKNEFAQFPSKLGEHITRYV